MTLEKSLTRQLGFPPCQLPVSLTAAALFFALLRQCRRSLGPQVSLTARPGDPHLLLSLRKRGLLFRRQSVIAVGAADTGFVLLAGLVFIGDGEAAGEALIVIPLSSR